MTSFLIFIFGAILLSGSVQSNDLNPFSVKVRSLLGDQTCNHLFSIKFQDPAQFKRAVQKAINQFSKSAGVTLPEDISDEAKEEASKEMDITSDQLFQVITNAVYCFLKQQGKLSSQNADCMARSLAHYLKKAEKSLNGGQLDSTFPSLMKAIAEFFNSVGFHGDQSKLQYYAYCLFNEIDNL